MRTSPPPPALVVGVAARRIALCARAAMPLCSDAVSRVEERRMQVAMPWRLSGTAVTTGVWSSSMAAEAASGALETQIGMCVCCALRLFASMRCSDVGMSCSYDAYICLNAQKLLNSYTNTYGTGHNEADNRHDAQPTDTVNKRLRRTLSLRAGQTGLRGASGAAARMRNRREHRCRPPRRSQLSRSRSPLRWRGRAASRRRARTTVHTLFS